MEKLQRLLLPGICLLLFVGVLGCEIVNEDAEENPEIEGLWERQGEDAEAFYVLIESETITVYEYRSGRECYNTMVLDIVSVEGDLYSLSSGQQQMAPDEVTIVREGDQLSVSFMEEEGEVQETYGLSDAEIASFTPSCSEDITGLWRLDSTEAEQYVHIEENYITLYNFDGGEQGADCYRVTRYEIITEEGDDYTLENTEDPQDVVEVTIQTSYDEMTVQGTDGENQIDETYYYSETSVENLTPECE